MSRIRTLLPFFVLCLALDARGQQAASTQSSSTAVKDKEAVTFDEIERGFFLGVSAGPFFILNPPAAAGGKRPFSPGQMAQVGIGYDLGEVLSVELFFTGSANRAGSDYVGHSTAGSASGDFSTFVPGAAARFNFLGMADAQETRRTWFYVRGGAGYVVFSPKELLPAPDLLVFAGPGVEYYTRLRHFSIGLEVTGSFLLTTGTLGFAVTPNLRYAF